MSLLEAPVATPKFGRHGERMTLDEFRRLPDDGIDRELHQGVVYVIGEEEQLTRRAKKPCGLMARVDHYLISWLDRHPAAEGAILSGEAGIDLPVINVAVGADVAYFRADALPEDFEDDTQPFVEAVPALAVEILSRPGK